MKMKRIFLSIFIIFFSLVGCGGGSQDGGDSREKKKGLADISRDIDVDIKLTRITGPLGEEIYKAEKVVLRPLRDIACDLEEVLMYPIGRIAKKNIYTVRSTDGFVSGIYKCENYTITFNIK